MNPQKLNPYVTVTVLGSGDLKSNIEAKNFDILVITDSVSCGGVVSSSDVAALNATCRAAGSGFINVENCGLASSIFVDYGDSFMVRDKNGENPKTAIVNSVTEEGEVGIFWTFGFLCH